MSQRAKRRQIKRGRWDVEGNQEQEKSVNDGGKEGVKRKRQKEEGEEKER